MASRDSVFWVLSALTLYSKFVGGTALEARVGWDGLEVLSTTADSTHTNNMADQLPAFDESLFEWETLKSKNGASFRVEREKTDCVKGHDTKAAAGKLRVGIEVYWPADGHWKPTAYHVADITGITFVRVSDSGKSELRYTLQFITAKTYDYYFEAESDEFFEAPTTHRVTPNTVRYDANNPTIVKVNVALKCARST